MAYNFKSISDVEVVAEPSESANVLIEENGVIKKAPKTAVGGIAGGSVEPDMVITHTGSYGTDDITSRLAITSGSPLAIKSKFEASEMPIVKVVSTKGTYGDSNYYYCEHDAFVTTYGVDYWFTSLVAEPTGPALWKLNGGFDTDGNFTWASCSYIGS